MSDLKRTCLGCGSRSSDIGMAYVDHEPCPNCGLPASATSEILSARQRHADAKLAAEYEELVLRVGRAEAEAKRWRDAYFRVREIVREVGPHDASEAATDIEDLREKAWMYDQLNK